MKKIMFNDRYGLTKAVLEGRKTMTRRIVKLENISCIRCINANYEDHYLVDLTDGDVDEIKPNYRLGEIVSVAQCYNDILAECRDKNISAWANVIANRYNGCVADNNKMFVRADLMPHQIRIKNIKIERLQDITDEDCIKEGIVKYRPRKAFADLIDRILGIGTWAMNPLVWVYEFELIR